MQPYKDYRDIILEYLLKQDIVTEGVSGDQKPPAITITGIQSGVTEINKKAPGWIIMSTHIGGISAYIQKHFRNDVQGFLYQGGFTKEEYSEEITNKEKVRVLSGLNANGREIDLPTKPITEWVQNPRVFSVLKSLLVEGYVKLGKGTEEYNKFEITELGYKSAVADKLLPSPITQPLVSPSVTVNNHGSNFGPQAYGSGSATQTQTGENNQIGETNTNNPTEIKKWYEKPWARWVGAVLAGLLIAWLSHLIWPGNS